MAERSVVVRIRAEIGDFRKQMQSASKAASEVGKSSQETASKSTVAMGQMAQAASKHKEAWDQSGKALLGFGAAVSVGIGLAIKSYMEFDKAMSEVKAATHASAADMGLLREAAIKAGSDTAFSAKEAADAITELSKAGVDTKAILGGGLKGSLDLAAAGSLQVADAAELAATAMVQFKLSGDKVPHLADLLAAGAGKAQGSVQDLGMALKQGGLIAASTGLSIEETTGGLAAFASAGLIGSDAGTSFKTMLQALTPNSAEAASKMRELGINAYDSQGHFVGLSKFAGILQQSMKGLSDEQRNAAMKVIFGSDAVRAANVLYEQGAKGISDWTDKVNDAGYAAVTAATKQDNLAGDLERLGGSLDSVFLKSASGANDVLRNMAQAADSFVDSIGQIPGPALQAGVGIAAIVGGAALLGGAFLTTFPRIVETRKAFDELKTSSPKLAGALGAVGKAAGAAGAALATLQIMGAISKAATPATKSLEETAQAFLKLSQSGKSADEIFNKDFFASSNGAFMAEEIRGVGDALKEVNNLDFGDNVNDFVYSISGGAVSSQINETRASLGRMDTTLTTLAKGGAFQKASEGFRQIAEAGKAQGISLQETAKSFPEYLDSLRQQASDLGVVVEGTDLLNWALGTVPASIQAVSSAQTDSAAAAEIQKQASEEAAKALAEIGLNADGTTASLSKLLDAMFATGLAQLSANEASIKWQEALESVDASLAKYGTNLDITTEGGKANKRALDGLAQAGIANAQAMAANGASQGELQKNLRGTYDSLIANYAKFGITGGAADTMARKVLGIPKGVKIDTAIQNYADSMAKLHGVGAEADALNGKTANIYITTHRAEIITSTRSDSVQNSGGGKTKGPEAFAEGGAISGPGTGTSDEILAMLSNGEHVLTAAEVQKLGGQAAVYRFRDLLMAGDLPKFASGGAAGHLGESANAKANRLYREAQAAAKKRAKLTAEQRQKLAELQDFRRDSLMDMDRDNRRGNGYRSVTDSLSSSYSFADKLTSLADSGKVGKSSIRNLYAVSGRSEAALKTLHARSDALGKSLDTAKDKLADLTQIRGNVANALSGEFSIGKTAQRQGLFGAGAVANTIADAKGFLAKVKGFASKLQKLRLKGFSGAIIEEIAGMGTTAGTQAADSLLQATSAQVKDLNNTMGSINAASLSAGNAVTDSLYRGGVAGATANVKSLERQEGAISKAMLQIGLGMENALRTALGGKPIKRAGGGAVYGPGTSTSDDIPALLSNGEHVLDAEDVDALGGQAAVYRLRAQLHRSPSKSLAGGYGQVQSLPAQYMGWGAAPAAAAGHVTHNWKIYDQTNPVATAHEVSRRQSMLRN